MITLPPITALTATTSPAVPAVAANTYPEYWATSISILAPSPTGDSTAQVTLRNYDGSANLDPNPANGFTFTSDVFADAAQYGLFARTMAALLNLINVLAPVKSLQAQIAAANTALTALQATLAKQQTQLTAYQNQLAVWTALPDAAPAKAGAITATNANIATINTSIAATQASITISQAQITTLTSGLTTAQAALA